MVIREKVLVADGEPRSRRLVADILRSPDYDLLVAEEGEEALSLIREHHPAVAVLDDRMPGLDGREVAHAVVRDLATAGTHVLLMSSHATLRERLLGAKAGAEEWLTKPVSGERLRARVSEIVAEHKAVVTLLEGAAET